MSQQQQQRALQTQLADLARIEAILVSQSSPPTWNAVLRQHVQNVRVNLHARLHRLAIPVVEVVDDDLDVDDEVDVEVPVPVAPQVTVQTVDNVAANEVLTETCPVCCDAHVRSECATTSCGHVFGRTCLDRWCHIQLKSCVTPTCPLCKTQIDRMITYTC